MFKILIKLALVLFLGSLIFYSCESNNEEELYSDLQKNVCDTTNLSFMDDISPFLDNRCIGCHNFQNANGEIRLDNYDEVKKNVDNGRLLGAIEHQPGFEPMPLNQPMLPECDINRIKAWINAGAMNN